MILPQVLLLTSEVKVGYCTQGLLLLDSFFQAQDFPEIFLGLHLLNKVALSFTNFWFDLIDRALSVLEGGGVVFLLRVDCAHVQEGECRFICDFSLWRSEILAECIVNVLDIYYSCML